MWIVLGLGAVPVSGICIQLRTIAMREPRWQASRWGTEGMLHVGSKQPTGLVHMSEACEPHLSYSLTQHHFLIVFRFLEGPKVSVTYLLGEKVQISPVYFHFFSNFLCTKMLDVKLDPQIKFPCILNFYFNFFRKNICLYDINFSKKIESILRVHHEVSVHWP